MALIKLVIFDLDGTLTDSIADLTDAVNHMLTHFGKEYLAVSHVKGLVGQGARNLVERALSDGSDEDVERGLELFLAYNRAHIADKTALYPGVAETLAALKGMGIRQGVISNKNEELCRELLSRLGVGGYFEAVMGADSCPFRKPSPKPVLKLLEDLGVAPAEAMMVGDSINDVAAGNGAGVITVGCAYGYGGLPELAQADYLVDGFRDILELPVFSQY